MPVTAIIHQTSKTKDISWEERRLAARLRRLLPGWEYRLWDDADNLLMMRQHFPHLAERYEAIRFGVAKADVARCVYMHAFGGFYFDTDYKLLRTLDRAILDQSCVIPLEKGKDDPSGPDGKAIVLGNAVMGSSPGHPFWRDVVEHIFRENAPERLGWEADIIPATGPAALTNFFLANRDAYEDIALPEKNLFHPDISNFAMTASTTAETYGVHLHWGSWRGRLTLTAARTLLRRKLNAL